jgi:hypothetical protein
MLHRPKNLFRFESWTVGPVRAVYLVYVASLVFTGANAVLLLGIWWSALSATLFVIGILRDWTYPVAYELRHARATQSATPSAERNGPSLILGDGDCQGPCCGGKGPVNYDH